MSDGWSNAMAVDQVEHQGTVIEFDETWYLQNIAATSGAILAKLSRTRDFYSGVMTESSRRLANIPPTALFREPVAKARGTLERSKAKPDCPIARRMENSAQQREETAHEQPTGPARPRHHRRQPAETLLAVRAG
jgi:hypothetical protein